MCVIKAALQWPHPRVLVIWNRGILLKWLDALEIVWLTLTRNTMIYWVVVSNIFYFHPYLGKWSYFTNIFQMGWNHQLVYDICFFLLVNSSDIWKKCAPPCSTLSSPNIPTMDQPSPARHCLTSMDRCSICVLSVRPGFKESSWKR